MEKIETEFYEKGKDILLILTGLGGSLKGFENKYERIAKQVMNDHGYSVAVVATPMDAWDFPKEILRYAMDFLNAKAKDKNFKVYTMGSSAGANIVLSFSYLFPQIEKVLAINPVISLMPIQIEKGITGFTGETIQVVFGEDDPSSPHAKFLPRVPYLHTVILPGIDHQFVGNLPTFLELPNHYLFEEET